MSEIPTIGEVIRQWRKHAGINLTTFAKQAGMSKGYISALENNIIKNPTPENLEKLAAAIGITVRELLARKQPDDLPNTDILERTAPTSPDSEEDDFTFASPLKTPHRRSDETAQLRQLLAQVDELRTTIETLIAQKEQEHGRAERP